MELRNLGQTNITKINGLVKELKKENPAIIQRVFDEKDEPDKIVRRLNELEIKLDTVLDKISFIFGDYFLLEGKFISLTKGLEGGQSVSFL